MTMDNNDKFYIHRIKNAYRDGMIPLVKGEFIEKYGHLYFDIIQKIVSSLVPEDMTFLSGYYASDVTFRIEQIPGIFKDRSTAKKIFYYNMLAPELIHDILLFDKFRDTAHFFAIFGKYIHKIVGDPGEQFTAWIKSWEKYYPNKNDTELQLKTLAALNFVILHEFSHLNSELTASTLTLFRETALLVQHAGDISSEELTETACDFNALYVLTSDHFPLKKSLNDSLGVSSTDILAYGILMQNASCILKILKSCFSLGTSISTDTIDDIFTAAKERLTTRTFLMTIALKLSQNTASMHMGDLDIQNGFKRASDILLNFFYAASDAMLQMSEAIHDINTDRDTPLTLTTNELLPPDKVWFMVQ